MKTYWNSLNERERWMVLSAAVCVIVYIYSFFLYAPLSAKVTHASAELVEKRQTLAWMRQVQEQAHTATKKQTVDNGQLLTLLANQLKSNEQLNIPYQLLQTSSGDIQLIFEAVPFQLFVHWLASINEQYAFTVKQWDLEPTQTAGVVRMTLVLSAASD